MSAKSRKCPTPEKQKFSTRYDAERVMRSLNWRNKLKAPTRVYRCRGGHYHLTSKT